MGGWEQQPGARLALLVDPDQQTARDVRPLLQSEGLELIHARAGMAALELLQRMPGSFAIAFVSLQLPDISGTVLVETLRLFRPEIPVVCLTDGDLDTVDTSTCLAKPLQKMQINAHLTDALAGRSAPVALATLSAEAIARAQEGYAVSRSLIDAARELSRGA